MRAEVTRIDDDGEVGGAGQRVDDVLHCCVDWHRQKDERSFQRGNARLPAAFVAEARDALHWTNKLDEALF